MKNYKIALLLLLTAFAFTGCKKDKDDNAQLILGKWKIQSVVETNYVNGVLDGTPETYTDDNYTLEFFADGKVKLVDNSYSESNTYKIDGNTLTVTNLTGKTNAIQISKLTKTELSLTSEDSEVSEGKTYKEVEVENFIKQ